MIRERKLSSLSYISGAKSTYEIPKDAVFHQLQLVLTGRLNIAYGATPTASKLAPGFPYNMINQIRLIRNGSDVVWQGSGKQLAKETMYLNGEYPQARVWGGTTSSTLQTLLLQTVNGVSIPSNAEGIGANVATFQDGSPTASTTQFVNFRAVGEIWLQLGVDEFFTTLVDARPLASFVLEVTWAQASEFIILGTNGTLTVDTSTQLLVASYDQDNVASGVKFGTFKRSSISATTYSYSSSNNQQLLPRGNFYYGIILEALAFRSGGLATIGEPGNDIVSAVQNRVNSNYYLRDTNFTDLQAKNRIDSNIGNPYDVWSGGPQGWAQLLYPCTDKSLRNLVATYTMDVFDILFTMGAGTEGGAVTGNPIVNILTQEVIPGQSIAPNAPRGSQGGSISMTSAKPGM